MYNTFNMGLGMIIAVDPAEAERALEALKAAGEQPGQWARWRPVRKAWTYAESRRAGVRRGDKPPGYFGRHGFGKD